MVLGPLSFLATWGKIGVGTRMNAHDTGDDDTGASTTTTIPLSDTGVGVRVSEATLVRGGTDTAAVKLAVCAGGAQGSVTMDIERARAVCDAIEVALPSE